MVLLSEIMCRALAISSDAAQLFQHVQRTEKETAIFFQKPMANMCTHTRISFYSPYTVRCDRFSSLLRRSAPPSTPTKIESGADRGGRKNDTVKRENRTRACATQDFHLVGKLAQHVVPAQRIAPPQRLTPEESLIFFREQELGAWVVHEKRFPAEDLLVFQDGEELKARVRKGGDKRKTRIWF